MSWASVVTDEATERFWAKVDRSGYCWAWQGATNAQGYGKLRLGGYHIAAHRFAWFVSGRSLTAGLVLDHLCRNRACVNPAHLEEVTQRENTLRGESPFAKKAAQTHCIRGHEFTDANTYRPPGRPRARYCRACHRDAAAAARRKAA